MSPLVHEPKPAGPRVSAQPSIAVELEWALSSAERLDWRRDHAGLSGLYAQLPDLVERIKSTWPPKLAMSCGGFIELMVLAHAGGLLFSTDADGLLGRLDQLCRRAPTDLALASEMHEDQEVVRGRLELLRSSSSKRRQYVAMISDAWSAVAGLWEREGRPAVERVVAERRSLIAAGAPWWEVARNDCDFADELPGLVQHLGPAGELVVVPAYFTHLGLIVDLPGTVVVGVRVSSAGDARARTEHLARRLKAISDPTRLAIVDALRQGPSTVTELARSFSLAQPTVSNHVKVLRDSGLVTSLARGGRRELTLQSEAAGELLEHLDAVLGGTRAPAG